MDKTINQKAWFLVLPVFGLVYLLAAAAPWPTRLRRLAGATAALIVSSGWYLLLVELWPASSRPYVGGSQDDSIVELALGYNGIGRLTGEEVGGGHDHARRAKAALQAMMLAEGLLHRMQRRAIGGQPLDGLDLMTVGHHRKRRAGLHRLAVQVHDAGAALRGVAADMGACQPQVFAQELDQKGTGVDIRVNGIAVHDH